MVESSTFDASHLSERPIALGRIDTGRFIAMRNEGWFQGRTLLVDTLSAAKNSAPKNRRGYPFPTTACVSESTTGANGGAWLINPLGPPNHRFEAMPVVSCE